MASVWLARPDDRQLPQKEWYKRLGRGENIRRLGLPIRLTRVMAHRFLSAPSHCTAVEAIRWAQVLGLGGSPALAKAILVTRLGQVLENEAFWETVIQFFVNAPDMGLEHVGPIVDYLQHRLFESHRVTARSGEDGPGAPFERPEFSMAGRTPASLLRLVDAWHRELGRKPVARITWPRSTLREVTWIERVVVRKEDDVHTEEHVWSIRELCSADKLVAEGRAMRHCVATYTSMCAARTSSIWSMRVETPREHEHRILTIEVDMRRRRIVQARRKYNALPTDAERAALGRWAAREGLGVEDVLRP
jgi:hypothetical protein